MMADTSSVEAESEKNRAIVEALLRTMRPLVEKLTPEVEPATVYDLPARNSAEDAE